MSSDKQLIKISNVNSELIVFWTLWDFCNQHCSYCTPNLHEGKLAKGIMPGNPTDDDIRQFMDNLIGISTKRNIPIRVYLSGGEPTVHKLCPEIVEKLAPYGIIEIATNGTRQISWWDTLTVLPHKVIISIHTEYYNHDKHNFVRLAEYLLEKGVGVHINILCLPSKWDMVTNLIELTPEYLRTFMFLKIVHDFTNIDRPNYQYTEEQMNVIKGFRKKYPDYDVVKYPLRAKAEYSDGTNRYLNHVEIVADNKHHFKGWKCSAGMNSITVKEDGTVHTGICRNNNIGTMTNFILPDDFITCNKSACVCPADLYLTKFKVD